MRRPTATKELIRSALIVFAEKNSYTQDEADAIAEEYSLHDDGFDLTKKLEKWQDWDCTRDDMDKLDEVSSCVRDALKAAEQAWFSENDIQPPFPNGTLIKQGLITGVSPYDVAVFHVKEPGHDDEVDGWSRLCIKFEDAEVAA